MRKHSFFAAFLFSQILVASSAGAFEVDGYRLGESEKAAAERLKRSGQIRTSKDQSGGLNTYATNDYSFSFFTCDQKVTSIQKTISYNANSFVNLVDQYTLRYGAGQYKVITQEGKDRRIAQICIRWSFTESNHDICMFTTELDRPSVSQSWSAPSRCSP